MASLNVLITAASRRVPLVHAFKRALARTGGGAVIVTDVNPLSPAVYAADRAYRVPMATESAYIDEIRTICENERIGLVVPTIDDELIPFATVVPEFANDGIRVAVSPIETNTICNDKYLTCRTLITRGIEAAPSFLPDELPTPPGFPLFIKPRFGRGSVGAFPVRSSRELAFFTDYVADPVVQTYLDGPEFTIDMLCDFNGRPLSIVPRERVVIRAGVTDRGRTVDDRRLIDLAATCASALAFTGAVNIQCRSVGCRPVIFEINPRFSGGIPLTIEAGADFPRMLVDLTLGHAVPATIGHFRANLWMTSYETSTFLDESRITLEPCASVNSIEEMA